MKTLKQLALVAAAVAVAASPALAGTKYAANLVSNSPTHPVLPPSISAKSSVKLSDKGSIQVGLAGVVVPGMTNECYGGSNEGDACTMPGDCLGGGVCGPVGDPVTSTSTYNETGTLDGTEYIVIIKLVIPGITGLIERVELPVPVVLSKGKGKTKLSAAALFAFIPMGIGRTLEIIGSEVWGPLGANAAACQAVIDQAIPASLIPPMSPPDPSCRGGSQVGMSGLAIP